MRRYVQRRVAMVAMLVIASFATSACSQWPEGGTGPNPASGASASAQAPSVLPPPASLPETSPVFIKKDVPSFRTDQTIVPTAIVLHWWGYSGKSDINSLIRGADRNLSRYNPDYTYNPRDPKASPPPVVGHVSVQVGVTQDGKAYQLTPRLNSFARHAKCANTWGIGIEIEGTGPTGNAYIGNNPAQLQAVIKVVKELMTLYRIPATSMVAADGKSGNGIVSHKMVDARCQWAGGAKAGEGKDDVDDTYLQHVIAAVK